MHRSENSNKHTYMLSLPRSVRHPKESTFLPLGFQESISIFFLESSGLILGPRTFGSKFSCTEFGLVPQVNTNLSWLPLCSVFFYLCFSHLEIFCFLFCRKLQSNWFFLSGSHHNRLLFQTTSMRVSDLQFPATIAVSNLDLAFFRAHSTWWIVYTGKVSTVQPFLKTKPSTRMCK